MSNYPHFEKNRVDWVEVIFIAIIAIWVVGLFWMLAQAATSPRPDPAPLYPVPTSETTQAPKATAVPYDPPAVGIIIHPVSYPGVGIRLGDSPIGINLGSGSLGFMP